MENLVATRPSIAEYFGTDELTTHRILMNLDWGFFAANFGDAAKEKWDEAHPFLCSAHPSKDYHSLSLKFIEQHFELFSTMQFTTSAGWEYNEKTGKMDWVYNSRYVKVN
jgi:hypothetical protein